MKGKRLDTKIMDLLGEPPICPIREMGALGEEEKEEEEEEEEEGEEMGRNGDKKLEYREEKW